MFRTLVFLAAYIGCAIVVKAQSSAGSWVMKLGNVQVTSPQPGAGDINAVGTREQILADPRITIVSNGNNLLIRRFAISLKQNNGELWGPFTGRDAVLPEKFISALQNMTRPEGTIHVEELKVNTVDGTIRTANPIHMKMVLKK